MSHNIYVEKTTNNGDIDYHIRFREMNFYGPEFNMGYLNQQLMAGGLPYEELDPVITEMRRQFDQLTGDGVPIGTWADPSPVEEGETPPSPRQTRRQKAAARAGRPDPEDGDGDDSEDPEDGDGDDSEDPEDGDDDPASA